MVAPAGGAERTVVPSVSATRSGCQHVPDAETQLIHGRIKACGKSLVDGMGHRVRLLAYEFAGMLPGYLISRAV